MFSLCPPLLEPHLQFQSFPSSSIPCFLMSLCISTWMHMSTLNVYCYYVTSPILSHLFYYSWEKILLWGGFIFFKQFSVVGKSFFLCFLSQTFFPHNEWGFVWINNSLFKGIKMCLIFLYVVIFIVNCLFLLEMCLWRFFEVWVEVEDFFTLAIHFGALPIFDHLNINFSFWGFSEYIGNKDIPKSTWSSTCG